MKVRFITVIILTFFGSLNVAAKEKKSKEIPYFLKEYAAQYQKSPREATLAWFEQARMGMFIHWGVRGKHHSAWAMYNKVIQLEEYQQLAHDVDASKFSALEIVKLAEESGMCYITFVAELSNVWNERGMPLLSTSPLGSIGFYDKHNLKLSHNSKGKVTFKIDVEPNDHGFRITYQTVAVKSGETFEYSFPETFQSRWIRFVDDKACVASTWFEYR